MQTSQFRSEVEVAIAICGGCRWFQPELGVHPDDVEETTPSHTRTHQQIERARSPIALTYIPPRVCIAIESLFGGVDGQTPKPRRTIVGRNAVLHSLYGLHAQESGASRRQSVLFKPELPAPSPYGGIGAGPAPPTQRHRRGKDSERLLEGGREARRVRDSRSLVQSDSEGARVYSTPRCACSTALPSPTRTR